MEKSILNKKYLPHTWVDPRVVVKESPIAGRGLFTAKDIKKDEIVMIWGGMLVPHSAYEEGKYRDMTLVPIDDTVDIGLPITDITESVDEYLNHSCDPTTWLIDEVTLVARRDIKKGEEITLDVATWDTEEEFPYSDDGTCYCGTTFCRKTLFAKDWMKPDVQKRYAGHFSPYIQRKIDNTKKKVSFSST